MSGPAAGGRGRGARRIPRALRRLLRRTPLRIRLVAALLLLVLVALAGSGAAAAATLRSYLVGRVDAQLSDALQPIIEHGLDGMASSHGGPDGGSMPDGTADTGGTVGGGDDHGPLPSSYVAELLSATGTVLYGPMNDLVDSSQPLPLLPHPSAPPTKARTLTVGAVRGGGQWRVLIQPVTLSGGTTATLLVAQSLSDVHGTVQHLELVLLVIGVATVLLLAGVGYVVVRSSLRPLRAIERTAADIAAGDLSHRVPAGDPRTETGHLAESLNSMLGQIETAFAERAASTDAAHRSEQRMRRFVADASHELRTPLTTIRGFAELYRTAPVRDQDQVQTWMRRIEQEAQRMGLLVEDLLLLARLDQQRPLAEEPVDLLALAGDAVTDARVSAPDRSITLRVLSADPPPVVIGDEARLRQVLANLLGNAVQHTPAGTAVEVSLETRLPDGAGPGRVLLTVADEGPGMTAQDAERVFERFFRASAARTRADGGTGLGLAIASALVSGSGGSLTLDTAPGAGARFRIELPLTG